MEKKTSTTVICPEDFCFGADLAQELIKLRRFILDMACAVNQEAYEGYLIPELPERLYVLNYLIEDVKYVWDTDKVLTDRPNPIPAD